MCDDRGVIPRVDFAADAILGALRADGAAICEAVLDAQRVRSMHIELDAILDATPTGRNDFEGFGTKRIYRLFGKTRSFDDLATDPVLLGVVEGLIGPAQLSAPTGILIGAGEPAQVLHRDDSIYPLPEPHDEVVLNTMWAFDDFTVANGATRFVVGSNRWPPGRRPTDEDELAWTEMPAGSVRVLHREHLARWRRQPHRHRPPGRHPRVRRGVVAPAGEPRHRGRARGDGWSTRTPPGAARVQHLPAVRRLRRRSPSPPLPARTRLIRPTGRDTLDTSPV